MKTSVDGQSPTDELEGVFDEPSDDEDGDDSIEDVHKKSSLYEELAGAFDWDQFGFEGTPGEIVYDEKVAYLKALLVSKGMNTLASRICGRSVNWAKKKMTDDPAFKDAVQAVRDLINDLVEQKLFVHIDLLNAKMIQFYLSKRHPEYKNKVELSAPGGGPVAFRWLKEGEDVK